MTNAEKSRLELERRIHDLLCGAPQSNQRNETLARIVRDEEARKMLGEMLAVQAEGRAAFGLDQGAEAMQQSLAGVKAVLRRLDSARPAARQRAARAWAAAARWLLAVAAAGMIAASLYVAITARSDNRHLRDELGAIRQAIAAPAMPLMAADVDRLRFIWDQVTANADTWVLVSNDGAEFGTIPSLSRLPPPGPDGRVLFVRCRILDSAGRCVYAADLLIPDRRGMQLALPEAGEVIGRPTGLRVAASQTCATVGLAVGPRGAPAVGVTGHAQIGAPSNELGSFRLDGEDLRVFVKALRLSGFRSG